jgi:hypothetical protein
MVSNEELADSFVFWRKKYNLFTWHIRVFVLFFFSSLNASKFHHSIKIIYYISSKSATDPAATRGVSSSFYILCVVFSQSYVFQNRCPVLATHHFMCVARDSCPPPSACLWIPLPQVSVGMRASASIKGGVAAQLRGPCPQSFGRSLSDPSASTLGDPIKIWLTSPSHHLVNTILTWLDIDTTQGRT